MPSFALQANDAGTLLNTPISQAVYDAALTLQAAEKQQPAPLPPEQQTPLAVDPCIRALTDIPPFLDQAGREVKLRAGDVATVTPGIAVLLVNRGKAALVEATA